MQELRNLSFIYPPQLHPLRGYVLRELREKIKGIGHM